jgi:prophage regulatory protein
MDPHRNSPTTPNGSDVWLPLPEVCRIVGARKSKIYMLISEGRFPNQVKIGTRSFWSVAELSCWMAERLANRRTA